MKNSRDLIVQAILKFDKKLAKAKCPVRPGRMEMEEVFDVESAKPKNGFRVLAWFNPSLRTCFYSFDYKKGRTRISVVISLQEQPKEVFHYLKTAIFT